MRWLTNPFRRAARERELDAELQFHFDEHLRESMARGASAAEARRAARREIGGLARTKDEVRDIWRLRWIEDLVQDVRLAVRTLRHQPGFASVAVLTLGLGVGAATGIFSVAKPVLVDPLGYPAAERILSLTDRSADGAPVPVAFGTFREVVDRTRSFEDLAVYKPWQPSLTGRDEPQRLEGQRVSAAYFDVLGVSPALGPGFSAADDRVGASEVVVLSDGLWRRAFGAEAEIVGTSVRLDGVPHRIVGVMPPGFENAPYEPAEVWATLQYDHALPRFDGREWGHHLGMLGRVRGGIGVAAAVQELREIADDPISERPRPAWAALGNGLGARSLRDATTAASRPLILTLMGGVLLLLAIASVNASNLLLARGARRRGEFALRIALGAGSGRLVRQIATESLVLAALGGVLGLTLARYGIGVLVASSPTDLPRLHAATIDGTVLGFALATVSLTGLAAGLAAAFGQLARRAVLPGTGIVGEAAAGSATVRQTLVVAQVAFALVLLVGAGLLLRTSLTLFRIDPGFETDDVLVMRVHAQGSGDAVLRGYLDALDAVRRLPEVVEAGLTSQLPLSGDADVYGAHPVTTEPEDASSAVYRYAVTPSYFATLGVPLVRGRLLEVGDDASSPPVVVVSASYAARVFAGRNPLGQLLHVGRTDLPPYTVVGIVGDVEQSALGAAQSDAAYVTPQQWYFADRSLWYVLRTRAAVDPAVVVEAAKQSIWAVDPARPVVAVNAMQDMVEDSEAERRFALHILEAFGVLALVLAGSGLYGVLSSAVAERRHELGVRRALGASRVNVLSLVARHGMRLTVMGVAVGGLGSILATEVLGSLLFGVSRLDPVTYAGVIAMLGAVAALACCAPAWRAARVSPIETLRSE